MISRYRRSKSKLLKKTIKNGFGLLNRFILRRPNVFSRFSAEKLINDTIKYFANVNRDGKTFTWVHFFDAHMIYSAPQEYVDKYFSNIDLKNNKGSFVSRLEEKGLQKAGSLSIIWGKYDNYPIEYFPGVYRAAISYIDHNIGRLIEYLKGQRIYDQSMIIVTSDHGENLMDHGDYCNHRWLFDITTKVPLVIKYPGNRHGGQIDPSLVEHVDIYPTLLDHFGHTYEKGTIRGRVIRLNDGPKNAGSKRCVLSEHARNYLRSIRNEEWQYIEIQPEEEWRIRRNDPKREEISRSLAGKGNILLKRKNGAEGNCLAAYPEIAETLRSQMNKILNERRGGADGGAKNVNVDIAQQLRSLGYMD